MHLVRWFACWLGAAIVVGGAIGLRTFDPGGHPCGGSCEFGRTVLAPFLVGASIAVAVTLPVAVIAGYVRYRDHA